MSRLVEEASGYRPLEHTADLAFELWAPTEVGVLVQGARALTDVLTGGAPVAPVQCNRLAFQALDPEDRLVRWLNDIVYMALVDGLLFADGDLTLRAPGGLEAEVRGEPGAWDRIITEVKAVTYHGLELIRHDTLVVARIVVDV